MIWEQKSDLRWFVLQSYQLFYGKQLVITFQPLHLMPAYFL